MLEQTSVQASLAQIHPEKMTLGHSPGYLCTWYDYIRVLDAWYDYASC